MQANITVERYSRTAQLLHWLIALLVVAQFALVLTAEAQPRGEFQSMLMALHKSVGVTVLMLAIVRILWRVLHKPPSFPATMPVVERRLSALTHWLLYFLIFAMPISGWMWSSAADRDVEWFWLFAMPRVIGANKSVGDFFHEVHEILAWALFALALLHILAALWHAVLKKDGVMQRMLP